MIKVNIEKIEDGFNGKGGLIGKIAYIKCFQCGNIKRVSYSRIKNGAGKHCSKKCYKISQMNKIYVPNKKDLEKRGKAISLAKGKKTGWRTSLHLRLRESREYKEWREKVFKRDNYTCRVCGRKGVRLHAHHLWEFSKFPTLRFDIRNGLTICIRCHRKTKSYLFNPFRDKNGRYTMKEKYLEKFL